MVTLTDPASGEAGLVAVSDVSLPTAILVVTVLPKFTAVASVKPDPVMVTTVPPVIGPDFGEMPVTFGVGGGEVNLKNFSIRLLLVSTT